MPKLSNMRNIKSGMEYIHEALQPLRHVNATQRLHLHDSHECDGTGMEKRIIENKFLIEIRG